MSHPGPGPALVLAMVAAACGGGLAYAPGTDAAVSPADVVVRPAPVPTTLPEPPPATVADELRGSQRSPPPLFGWRTAAIDEVETPARQAPVGLVIPSIGVDAPVIPLGVAGGEMEVPDNVTDVGWYRYGPSPGEPGSAVLAAHVDMAGEGPGVFFHLDRLAPGDAVTIVFADFSMQTFRVVDGARISKEALDVARIFSQEGPPVVTLVTCGGGFNRTLRQYDSNVVVTLAPAEGERA